VGAKAIYDRILRMNKYWGKLFAEVIEIQPEQPCCSSSLPKEVDERESAAIIPSDRQRTTTSKSASISECVRSCIGG
jgi:hypothetical protein